MELFFCPNQRLKDSRNETPRETKVISRVPLVGARWLFIVDNKQFTGVKDQHTLKCCPSSTTQLALDAMARHDRPLRQMGKIVFLLFLTHIVIPTCGYPLILKRREPDKLTSSFT